MPDAAPAPRPSAARPPMPPVLTVTLLGTGTSTGVPVVGCDCRVCRSPDARDARLRCAALLEVEIGDGTALSVLVDAGPDFRQQALRHDMTRLDAVLLTHAHFDHIAGLDDLRPFFFGNRTPLPCYADDDTAGVLRRTLPYVFVDDSYAAAPRLELCLLDDAPFEVASRYDADARLRVEPLPVLHGEQPITGYRLGPFAYLTDVSHIPEATYDRLDGLDLLVLDALRPRPHPTHFSFEEAVAAARRIGARQTYFTHMTHDVLHAEAEAHLPEGVGLAHDGLTVTVGLDPAVDIER